MTEQEALAIVAKYEEVYIAPKENGYALIDGQCNVELLEAMIVLLKAGKLPNNP